jgi:hypothetical protein
MFVAPVRKWLTDNKVFFETIAAITLSVMGVLVSCAQDQTAKEQTQYIALQSRVAAAEAVCTENLSSGVVVVKSAKDGV